jgi:UPF0755 protein
MYLVDERYNLFELKGETKHFPLKKRPLVLSRLKSEKSRFQTRGLYLLFLSTICYVCCMRKLSLYIAFTCFAFLLLGTAWLYAAFSYSVVHTAPTPILFIVPKGATVSQMAHSLRAQGISRETYYLLLLAKPLGVLRGVKAGEYQIASHTTPKQLIAMLAAGQRVLHKITFPEGWTFHQMRAALAAEPRLSHVLQDKSDPEIMAALGHPEVYPEGMFYPDTYLFTRGTEDQQILRLAYQAMQKKLARAWAMRAADAPYTTPYAALIVASLIEREVSVPKERPMVAGVILRRLEKNMRLQIDASVLYPSSLDAPLAVKQNNRKLTYSVLAIDTPYNTYTRYGLPPTPIAMPGSASLHAALHPSAGTALYYVAQGDGSHVFSDNFAGHIEAVRAYRRYVRASASEGDFSASSTLLYPMCVSASLVLHYLCAGPKIRNPQ